VVGSPMCLRIFRTTSRSDRSASTTSGTACVGVEQRGHASAPTDNTALPATGALLFVLAFGFGFVAAIPLGGSQIEMAKRAMQGHLRAALAVVLGSVTSDVLYGIIALYGIAPFMREP
jgi:hypothetical protein